MYITKKNEHINNKYIYRRILMEEKERKEDTTKYGEFIPSYFAWLTLEKQKENANKLSDITKK